MCLGIFLELWNLFGEFWSSFGIFPIIVSIILASNYVKYMHKLYVEARALMTRGWLTFCFYVHDFMVMSPHSIRLLDVGFIQFLYFKWHYMALHQFLHSLQFWKMQRMYLTSTLQRGWRALCTLSILVCAWEVWRLRHFGSCIYGRKLSFFVPLIYATYGPCIATVTSLFGPPSA